jgi:3-deoxy-D-manno-octulosonate 8-phosphate phosphatase (KDO 8-P phosphatase)
LSANSQSSKNSGASGPSLARIRAIALDVDGVLTDGAFWWGPDGQEWKRFAFADVMGVSLARRSGLKVALISGEDSPLVDRFALKMGIADVHKNCKDKAEALRRFAGENALELDEVCFMGDDVNDLGALDIAGLAAAPADARPEVLAKAAFVAACGGGNGAVRELIDSILAARGAPHPAAKGNP